MFRGLMVGILSLSLMVAAPEVFAAPAAPGTVSENTAPKGARHHLANIVFAGLAGAILGLSTLSFYGRPQDYLSNIAVGFAIGVIAGTAYTTYKAATEPREFYGLNPPKADSSAVDLWAYAESARRDVIPATAHTGLVFEF